MNSDSDAVRFLNENRNEYFHQKMLLRKRRTQSETRNEVPTQVADFSKIKSNIDLMNAKQTSDKTIKSIGMEHGMLAEVGRRKTTAELIKEAKTYLSNAKISGNRTGALKIVSTKRPITPRETGRLLLGKVALKDRPPSAFSLRYLQMEFNRPNKTPILEPILSNFKVDNEQQIVNRECKIEDKTQTQLHVNALLRKLPSLDETGQNECELTVQNRELEKSQNNVTIERNTPVDLNRLEYSIKSNQNVKIIEIEKANTDQLIDILCGHAGLRDCSEETTKYLLAILDELYLRLKGKSKNFKKAIVLGAVYGLVECTSFEILLAIARVVLVLHVTGSNLTGACKLIFKVARNEQNDNLFHENNILELLIDGLGRASPIDEPEACIYGYSAIRFLTSSGDISSDISNIELKSTAFSKEILAEACENKEEKRSMKQYVLVSRLSKHGAVELMILHLQILNESSVTKKLTGPPLHSLYQLAAALRALANLQNSSPALRGIHGQIKFELACVHLIRAAELSFGELEVQENIVRTLSVLSEDNDCCYIMREYVARIGMLLGPCCEFFDKSSDKLISLFSRLGYILGNIMAKYDSARLQFYSNDVAMEYLLHVLTLYTKFPLMQKNTNGDTVNDVLVKLIRVIANMSVNGEVGYGLGYTGELGAILLVLLRVSLPDESPDLHLNINVNVKKELLNATLGALHNLCFYQDKCAEYNAHATEIKDSLQSVLPDITNALCEVLNSYFNNDDIQVEVIRVLGNLTRNEGARQCFCERGGMTTVLQCLTRNVKQDYDLKACSIGVLVNLLGDGENRSPFMKLRGEDVLLVLLRGALNEEDWFLATIISQALWNLLIDMKNNEYDCDETSLNDICILLTDALDEERIFDGCTEINSQWEQFSIVATDLLERLHVFLNYQDYEINSENTE